jgi:hypothetical protein
MLSAQVALGVLCKVRTMADSPPSNGAFGKRGVARGIVYVLHSISAGTATEQGRSEGTHR